MIPRALLLTALLAFPVQTAPLLQAGDSRVTLTLYDEPCALFGLVRNLPFRCPEHPEGTPYPWDLERAARAKAWTI